MYHSSAVSVVDRVTNIHEPLQETSPTTLAETRILQGENATDRLAHVLAAYQPHREIRAAVGVSPRAVNGDHARVLKTPRHFRLKHQSSVGVRIQSVFLSKFLQRDDAIQFGVNREMHNTEGTLTKRAKYSKAALVVVIGYRHEKIDSNKLNQQIVHSIKQRYEWHDAQVAELVSMKPKLSLESDTFQSTDRQPSDFESKTFRKRTTRPNSFIKVNTMSIV